MQLAPTSVDKPVSSGWAPTAGCLDAVGDQVGHVLLGDDAGNLDPTCRRSGRQGQTSPKGKRQNQESGKSVVAFVSCDTGSHGPGS
jgi:hypothetical protein